MAQPVSERTPGSGGAPLDILSAQPTGIFVPTFGAFQDRLIIAFDSTTVTLISTELWDEEPDQPEAFADTVVGVTLLGNGTSLVIALSSGDLARIELDDTETFDNTETDDDEDEDEDEDTEDDEETEDTEETEDDEDTDDDDDEDDEDTTEATDSRVILASTDMTSAGIDKIVADPDESSETVYMINSTGYYYEFDLETEDLTEIDLTGTSSDDEEEDSEASTGFTLNNILFTDGSDGEKIFISTTSGVVLAAAPGATSFNEITVAVDEDDFDTTEPNLTEMAVTPDGNHVLVVDTDNDVVWVLSSVSEEFVDQSSSGSASDPITIDSGDNDALTNITIFGEEDGDEITAYVAGSEGLSLIDAVDAGDASSEDKVIDLDETTTSTRDPLVLEGTPGPVATSSFDDGYVYSANGDATISVITEKPFVTIGTVTPETVTEAAPTFTMTFQSDEAGTYFVRVNSDPTATDGTELIAETALDAADTDTTTAEINIGSFDRAVFSEGLNRVFIFVTDADGNIGRDAFDLTVDRPPGAITITGLQFGNKKAYVTFIQSDDSDIAQYVFYAEPAENQASPSCPGTLTFETGATVSSALAPSDCEDSECAAQIPGLTNDTVYCVAMRAVDESNQDGTLSTFSGSITPEQTVGPASFLGETGCSLHANPVVSGSSEAGKRAGQIICFAFGVVLLIMGRCLAATRPC